jgi:hypothetical protein
MEGDVNKLHRLVCQQVEALMADMEPLRGPHVRVSSPEDYWGPLVVCLCGSTRYIDVHALVKWELEKRGVIALMCSYLPGWYAEVAGFRGCSHFADQAGLRQRHDELHMRKIDLADAVVVINHQGYIGESTAAEIQHAKHRKRRVFYLEDTLIELEPLTYQTERRVYNVTDDDVEAWYIADSREQAAQRADEDNDYWGLPEERESVLRVCCLPPDKMLTITEDGRAGDTKRRAPAAWWARERESGPLGYSEY